MHLLRSQDPGRRPSPTRLRIVHLLVAIMIVPALTLPAFATVLVRDRLDQAAASSRIAGGLQQLAALDELRLWLFAEGALSILPSVDTYLTRTGGTGTGVPDPFAGVTGDLARQEVDARLRAVRATGLDALPNGSARLEKAVTPLTLTRQQAPLLAQGAGLPGSDPATSVVGALIGVSLYARMAGGVLDLELELVQRVSDGDLGLSTAAQQAADQQVLVLARLIAAFTREYSAYLVTLGLPATPDGVEQLLSASGATTAGLAEVLATGRPEVARRAEQLMGSAEVRALRASVLEYVRDPAGVQTRVVGDQRRLVTVVTEAAGAFLRASPLSQLLVEVVRDAVGQAQADRAAAERRARWGAGAAGGAVLVSFIVLTLVGGLIRRRLGELADSAQQLSAGRFDPVPVRGPREVALAAGGLDDAARGLREVTRKAALIAAGDLTSPELQRASPGPLGAALHASVARVVDTMHEREVLQLRLAHEATHDALTGLVNRAEAERRLRAAVVRARAEGSALALLFLDLDRFKAVNDEYGHHAGDRVLVETAVRMRSSTREGDLVCRLGGDEFLVLMTGLSMDPTYQEVTATETAHRIVAAVARPVAYRGHLLQIGVSVGIATWPQTGADLAGDLLDGQVDQVAEGLLARADDAVYRAKRAGRGTATF